MMAAATPVSVDWWDREAPMDLRITDYLDKVGGQASEHLICEKMGISYGKCREICHGLIRQNVLYSYVRDEILIFALEAAL